MTEVAFHFNAPDRLGYACRLLRKAYLHKARLFVWSSEDDLVRLDTALWIMGEGEFVPHCRDDDSDLLKRCSPIQLGQRLPADRSGFILVNLRQDMPDDAAAFGRIIEVVTLDESDRASARERWRRYRALGLDPQRHDLQSAPAN